VPWEAEAQSVVDAGIRLATIRTGIVLTTEGGALPKMLPLFKLGVGGRFGRGTQWMSWIALEDEVGAILHLLTSEAAVPVNLTSPHPVRNGGLAAAIGDVLHRPTVLPVPAFGPRLVLGGERADALLFESQSVRPRVLQADGYTWSYPELVPALRSALRR